MSKRNPADYAFGLMILLSVYAYGTAAICLTIQFFAFPIHHYMKLMGADISIRAVYFGITLMIITWAVVRHAIRKIHNIR